MRRSFGSLHAVVAALAARVVDAAIALLPRPRRAFGIELLDSPDVDADTRLRALSDVARANAYFGGTRAVAREIVRILDASSARTITLVDVGTGTGDIARRAATVARERGVRLTSIRIDISPDVARSAHASGTLAVCGDALSLPFADRSVDVVVCSQLLHHFRDHDVVRLLRELHRVARLGVIVSDLRRSWIAAGGFWVATFPLRFHPVSRHDGVVSILRAFTAGELARLVRTAVGEPHAVRRVLGFRLAVSWAPTRFACYARFRRSRHLQSDRKRRRVGAA